MLCCRKRMITRSGKITVANIVYFMYNSEKLY